MNLRYLLLNSALFLSFYGLCQTCEKRTDHHLTFDKNVILETTNPSVKVRFYFSGALASLQVKVKPPKIIAYEYKGKVYNAEKYGFEYFTPNSSKSIAQVINCLTKSKALVKNAWELNVGNVFNTATGDVITIKNGKKEWANDSQWKEFTSNFVFSESDICQCQVVIANIDYSGIEKIIEKELERREQKRKFEEAQEKQKKEMEDFDKRAESFQNSLPKTKTFLLSLPVADYVYNEQNEQNKQKADSNRLSLAKKMKDIKITMGTMTDNRDGQQYKTVTHLNRKDGKTTTWMAENLNYMVDFVNQNAGVNKPYQPNAYSIAHRKKYGLLYNLDGTLDDLCPSGWRLPTISDFESLCQMFGVEENFTEPLRSSHGWNNNNGYNSSKMNILPSGFGPDGGPRILNTGKSTSFIVEETKNFVVNSRGQTSYTNRPIFSVTETYFGENSHNYWTGYSCRCIKK